MMGASVELRCDCSRRRTQAASRIDVFPWPLRATRKLNPGENSIPSSSKHRKFRNCRSASITITELIAQPCNCHLEVAAATEGSREIKKVTTVHCQTGAS